MAEQSYEESYREVSVLIPESALSDLSDFLADKGGKVVTISTNGKLVSV